MSTTTQTVRLADNRADQTVTAIIWAAGGRGDVTFRVLSTENGITTVELSGETNAVHRVYEWGVQDHVW